MRSVLVLLSLLAISQPALAKDSLGVYSSWAAFRDEDQSRCYAIAKPRSGLSATFASIATWPKQGLRNQLHIRLSRVVGDKGATLRIGDRRFSIPTLGRDAWAQDGRMDAAIVAALRSATRMSVTARDESGRRFTDRYDLAGAATAIDAAVVGCAGA